MEKKTVIPALFQEVYSKIQTGNPAWNSLETSASLLYPWESKSTYIQPPPFFDDMVNRVILKLPNTDTLPIL